MLQHLPGARTWKTSETEIEFTPLDGVFRIAVAIAGCKTQFRQIGRAIDIRAIPGPEKHDTVEDGILALTV